jgi:tetratricopeptide (TPR) repeat protein
LIVYYPNDRNLRYSLARYQVVNGRNDAAEKVFADVVANEPDAIEPKLTMVRFVLQTRGLEAALAQLDTYIKQHPEAYDLRFGQAELYTTAKQADKAKSVYETIVAEAGNEPDGLKARNRLAQLALAAKDEAGAEKLIREVLAADANNVQGLTLRAGLLAQKEKYDEAITDLRTALSEEPGSAQASVLLARVHLKLGQTSLAYDQYVRAIDANPKQSSIALEYARLLIQARSFNKADEVLEDLLARSPNLVAAMEMQAQVKLSLQQWAEAEALANKIKAAGSKDAAASQILGLALQGQKEYDESIAAFTQAHEAAPSAAQPMVALIRSYVASGKTQEAKDFLVAVVRTNENNYAAQFLLGRLYMADKEFDKAVTAFAKAVAANPKLGIGHYALATTYLSQGDQAKAVEALQVGVEATPDNAALKITLAGIHEKDGDYEAAIPLYEKVLGKLPDQPVARNNLASILADFKGDPESLSRALELATPLVESKVPHFRDTLGWVYYKSGDNDQALAILEGVVRDQPELGVFQYHLGMTYLALGDGEKAKQALEKAVALGEESPFTGLDEAKSALQSM